MSLLVRRDRIAVAGMPKYWRGPLPDSSVKRQLSPKGGSYTRIPESLLYSGIPDLGAMVWALLRLSFEGEAHIGSYGRFGQCFRLDDLSDTALDKRFGTALKPLLGTWIIRKRLPDNSYLYRAAVPAGAESERHAVLRTCDLDLLGAIPPEANESIEVSDLAQFCRWQLECGRRGWTVDPLRTIAGRWGVTHPTVARSRDRLARLGLLKVIPRSGGRFSDLIWLYELYDPHWDDRSRLEPQHVTVRVRRQSSSDERPQPRSDRLPGRPGGRGGWSEDHVHSTRHPSSGVVSSPPVDSREREDCAAEPIPGVDRRSVQRVSVGFRRLYRQLLTRTDDAVTYSLEQLSAVVDGPLPVEAGRSHAWWQAADDSIANAWLLAGRTATFDAASVQVTFILTEPSRTPQQIRSDRFQRRRRALAELVTREAPSRRSLAGRPHEVYIVHFPAEHRFKVGICAVGTGRIAGWIRVGGIEVDRVTVPNGLLAQLIEADVLLAVEPWQKFGNVCRPGAGATEMWSESGPSVDLQTVADHAQGLVARLQELLAEEATP